MIILSFSELTVRDLTYLNYNNDFIFTDYSHYINGKWFNSHLFENYDYKYIPNYKGLLPIFINKLYNLNPFKLFVPLSNLPSLKLNTLLNLIENLNLNMDLHLDINLNRNPLINNLLNINLKNLSSFNNNNLLNLNKKNNLLNKKNEDIPNLLNEDIDLGKKK